MKYLEMKEKHRKQIENFPIQFAFNEQQLKEGLEKLGVETVQDVVSTGHGGFIRKGDTEALIDMFLEQGKEATEAFKNEVFLTEALLYELANHEYCITGDDSDTKAFFNGFVDTESDHFKKCMVGAKRRYHKENEG